MSSRACSVWGESRWSTYASQDARAVARCTILPGFAPLVSSSRVLRECFSEMLLEKCAEVWIGLTKALGELRTKDTIPTCGVTRDAATVVYPRLGSIFHVPDRPIERQRLCGRFIRGRRRDRDRAEVVLVHPVVSLLLRMKPTTQKRHDDRQSDSNAHDSHDESCFLCLPISVSGHCMVDTHPLNRNDFAAREHARTLATVLDRKGSLR